MITNLMFLFFIKGRARTVIGITVCCERYREECKSFTCVRPSLVIFRTRCQILERLRARLTARILLARMHVRKKGSPPGRSYSQPNPVSHWTVAVLHWNLQTELRRLNRSGLSTVKPVPTQSIHSMHKCGQKRSDYLGKSSQISVLV